MIPAEFSDASRLSVLIVDPSEDSRDVLRTVLQRHGVDIFETPAADQGLELARRHHPQVIVLDLESDSTDRDDLYDEFDRQATDSNATLLALGEMRGFLNTDVRQLVCKPYHYGPLIRKIEQLIDQARRKHSQGRQST